MRCLFKITVFTCMFSFVAMTSLWADDKTASTSGSTTTTTTEHTKTVQTVSSSSPSSSSSSPSPTTSSASGASGGKATGAQTGTSGAQTGEADKDKKDEKEDVNYTGVYNDSQIIPNSMAIFCKTNAEDMLKETQKLYDCVNKIVRKINDKDAAVRQEGSSELSGIRYEELKTMLAQAITKSATISNYEKIQKSTGEATGKTQTEHEDNVAIANTISTLTDVINSMRDLYAERLKAEAITGIASVDPSVIADIKNEDDGKSDKIDTGNESEQEVVNSSKMTINSEDENRKNGILDEGEAGDWQWLKDSICRRNIVEFGQGTYEDGVCPDGVYKTGADDTKVYCQDGSCREIYMSGKCGDDSLTVVSGVKLVQFMGTAKCSDGKKEVACADGMYVLDGYYYACKDGSCEKCSGVASVRGSSTKSLETTEQAEILNEEELNESRERHLTGSSSSTSAGSSSSTTSSDNVLSEAEASAARTQRGYGPSAKVKSSQFSFKSPSSKVDEFEQARQRRGY